MVQDDCIGVHNGLLIVIAGWSFWIFSSSSEKEARRRMDEVFKLLCCVFVILFQDFALKCRMGCSISLHGNAF